MVGGVLSLIHGERHPRPVFQVGSLLTMRVRLRKWLYVKSVETITAIAPQYLLAWKTRSPDWFLQGERFQVLTMIDTNTTQYWTRESFGGIFAPALKILLARDLQHGFDAVAQNLKARIERQADTRYIG